MTGLIDTWQNLCTPAQLYAILSVVSILTAVARGSVSALIPQILMAVVWTFALSWICTKGWTTAAWVLVLFPFILLLLVLFFVASTFTKTERRRSA
jgi:hypothetical protein